MFEITGLVLQFAIDLLPVPKFKTINTFIIHKSKIIFHTMPEC